MTRLTLDYEYSSKTRAIFDNMQKSSGSVLNIFKLMGHSSHTLEGFLAFSGSLAKGLLSAAEREHIGLALAGYNHCGYCASAHTMLAKKAGVKEEEIQKNLKGESEDEPIRTLIRFCYRVIEHKGRVDESDLDDLRSAGYQDEKIVEIVANIALNLFTNYFNHVFDTPNDFPKVEF